jgi:protein-ribulosamine 3-kinase
MLPAALQKEISRGLGVDIEGVRVLGGGCIANASRIETSRGPFFLKWAAGQAGASVRTEAEGLSELRRAETEIEVPGVVASGRMDDDTCYLVTDWLESGDVSPGFWERFGRAFAGLHRVTCERWGLGSDNFIGRLPQTNTWCDAWPEFFLKCRLRPQAKRARENGRWKGKWDAPMVSLEDRLSELIATDDPPSLLHGDLWSGNYMVIEDGRPAIFDPAVYYGHREADLAMTELFGGFAPPFYAAYREEWPLAPGYEERREVYNLYHLINHLNHFGESYAGGIERTLRRFA